MLIAWFREFADLLKFLRDGAIIARRRHPEELKRYLTA